MDVSSLAPSFLGDIVTAASCSPKKYLRIFRMFLYNHDVYIAVHYFQCNLRYLTIDYVPAINDENVRLYNDFHKFGTFLSFEHKFGFVVWFTIFFVTI